MDQSLNRGRGGFVYIVTVYIMNRKVLDTHCWDEEEGMRRIGIRSPFGIALGIFGKNLGRFNCFI